MGIYLPNMEMPKEGCYHKIYIYPDGTVPIEGEMYKAIPVTPHGLIAREQILDAIRLELAQADACNDTEDYDSWMRVFDYVRKFPTIIPEEEG